MGDLWVASEHCCYQEGGEGGGEGGREGGKVHYLAHSNVKDINTHALDYYYYTHDMYIHVHKYSSYHVQVTR